MCLSVRVVLQVVTVEDVNDNPPVFGVAAVAMSVAEDAPVGTVVGQLPGTTDADQAPAGNQVLVLHALVGGNDGSRFGIQPVSGVIEVTGPLDRETRPAYNLTARAFDRLNPSLFSDIIVTVTVLDANDQAPEFLAPVYEFAVPEDAAPGTFVGFVHAVDRDTGPNAAVRYNLRTTAPLTVDAVTGAVTTTGALDYDDASLREMLAEAVAVDGGQPAQTARVAVRVTVLDANDNAPVFASGNVTAVAVREDAPVGSIVARLNATDVDQTAGGEVRYLLADFSGGAASAFFTLESATGVVRLARALDFEAQRQFSLAILAQDRGVVPLTTRHSLEIAVLDVNDNAPQFEAGSDYELNVTEDGETLNDVHVHATDADSAQLGQVVYSLVGASGLAIDPQSGRVRVANADALDVDAPGASLARAVAVRACDGGVPPLCTTATLRLNIKNVNDVAPVFSQPQGYVFDISEAAPINTIVGTVAARDGDVEPEPLRFWTASAWAAVDEASGAVRLRQALDHEQAAQLTAVIYVADGRLNASTMVTLNVMDANEAPVVALAGTAPSVVAIEGNGRAVALVPPNSPRPTVSDPDGNGTVVRVTIYASYMEPEEHVLSLQYGVAGRRQPFVGLNWTSFVFELDGSILATPAEFIASLAFVSRAAEPLTATRARDMYVVVYDDRGQWSAPLLLTRVQVQLVNDYTPEWTPTDRFEFNVSATAIGTAPGATVGRVQAVDGDAGPDGAVQYSIVRGNTTAFAMDRNTGELRVTNPAAVTSAGFSTFFLIAMVQDGGNPPLHAFASVLVRVS